MMRVFRVYRSYRADTRHYLNLTGVGACSPRAESSDWDGLVDEAGISDTHRNETQYFTKQLDDAGLIARGSAK